MEQTRDYSYGKIILTEKSIEVFEYGSYTREDRDFKIDRANIKEIYALKTTIVPSIEHYHKWISAIALLLLFIIGSYFLVQIADSDYIRQRPTISKVVSFTTVAYFFVSIICFLLIFFIELLNNTSFLATRFYYLVRTKRERYVCLKTSRKENLILVKSKHEAEKIIDFLKTVKANLS